MSPKEKQATPKGGICFSWTINAKGPPALAGSGARQRGEPECKKRSVQAAGVGSCTGFFCRIEGLILSDAGEKKCVWLFLQRFLLW